MDGSNTNIVPEKEYDFLSTAVEGEKEYLDFQSVSYARVSTFLLICLISFVVCSVPQQFLLPQNAKTMLGAAAWILFVVAFLFFGTQKKIKDDYKRIVLGEGKESIIFTTYFGEKLFAETDQHAPVEFDYSAIISIKETNYFYLLGFKYRSYLIISKDVKSNHGNVDFVEYIFNKCPNIKKKKIKKVMNKKRECIIYLCLFVLLFLFHLIMFLI